jgi:hypothetical protein
MAANDAPGQAGAFRQPMSDARKRRLFRRLPPEHQEFLRLIAGGVNDSAYGADASPADGAEP